ncbi:MAG: type II secretion system F family protein [Acidobacteriaceae bacterium]|nr:type II secretion system F family protein [Acidobacteriaceae bacterium]
MLLFAAIFGFLFLIAALCVGLGQAFLVSRQKQQVRIMLRRAESEAGKRRPDLLKPEVVKDKLSKALTQIRMFHRLALFIEQAGATWSVGKFVSITAIAALAGLFIGLVLPPLSQNRIAAPILFLMGALVPLLLTFRKRSKRLAKFEEQFPEALNFLSRSMRAGHAFSIGLEMLVADAPEPLGSAFRQMLNDLHLGSTLEASMAKLVASVPLIDVRFFVSAILLQQGSGGNLSEILDSMARIIRERFQLKGQVKAASAHGRITGLILAVMPVVVAIMLMFISPDYLLLLFRDPLGKKLVLAACIGQIVGFLCIRKIVNIKV